MRFGSSAAIMITVSPTRQLSPPREWEDNVKIELNTLIPNLSKWSNKYNVTGAISYILYCWLCCFYGVLATFFFLFHDGFCQFCIKHEPFGETKQLDFTPLVSHLIYLFLHLLSVADLKCLLGFQELGELYSFVLLLPVVLKYSHENVNEYWLLSVRTTRLPIHF